MPDPKIPIETLTDAGARFEFEMPSGWWEGRAPESEQQPAPVEAPFRFDLEARRTGCEVLLEGTMTGAVGLQCSRCGKRYPHALRETYRLVLEPAEGLEGADPEGERALAEKGLCLGEDLEAGFYRGPLLWLDDFFGEVVALAMPIQPLCSESCVGICPHCGAERIAIGEDEMESGGAGVGGSARAFRATCDCEDEKIESPFAILASLKGGTETSG